MKIATIKKSSPLLSNRICNTLHHCSSSLRV
jgi:hypothetical protein